MQCKNNTKEKKLLNSIVEVKIDGKMALVSLYDDLPHFEYDMTIDNLKNSNSKLKSYIQELKQHLNKSEKENSNLKTVNSVLSKNITSLYKTASSEIQRKEKMIDELRKSRNCLQCSSRLEEKMFSSSNSSQLKETQFAKISDRKQQDVKQINNVKELKVTIENNNDNVTHFVIQPNRDIPKTIYNKRLCQKLAKENTSTEHQNQILKHTENIDTVAVNKIIQDKNEEINNDDNVLKVKEMPIQIDNSDTVVLNKITHDKNEEINNGDNLLKEMTIPLVHDPRGNLDSTLVICESDISDVTPSICEHDTTQIIQCTIPNKKKENVSPKSFFPKLKQMKLKKKMVISPATIGVQNTSKEIRTCAKKLNRSGSLDLFLECMKSNSSKDKINSSNKDVQSTLVEDEFTKNSSNIPTSNSTPQKIFVSENSKETESIHVKDQKIEIIKTKKIIKNNNNPVPIIVRKSSHVTRLGPSNDDKFNVSTKDIKYVSMNNEKQSSSSPKQIHQSNLVLPCIDIKYNPNTDSKHISTADTIFEQKSSTSENNNKKPMKKSMKIEDHEDNKVKIFPRVACDTKYHSDTDNEQISHTNIMSKQKSATHENTNQMPSVQIEVEQVPFKRKKIVIEKGNKTVIPSDLKKYTRDACVNPSIDKLKIVTKSIESLPVNSTKVSSSPPKQKQNQSNCILSHMDTKCHYNTDSKQISSTDFISKQTFSTCEINNKKQSINVEDQKVQIKRKRRIMEKENNNITPTSVRRPSCKSYFSSSNDNDLNMSTKYVKCASMNNENESSSLPKQKHNQSKSVLPCKYTKCNSTDDKQISTVNIIFGQNMSTSENNIEMQSMQIEDLEDKKDQIIKQIKAMEKEYKSLGSANEKKPLSVSHLSSSNGNEIDLVNCSPKNTGIETFVADKTGAPSISIEVEQGSIFKHSSARRVIMHPSCDKKNQEVKKGRRVQLITIKDHCSKPLPSFNGAKKTEIDVSKKSIHTEKVVESSSCFYIPQVKRRRTMNFSNSEQ